jgi:hypothetical protein
MFGHGSQNVDSYPVRCRKIDGLELNAGLHKVGNEGDVPG